MAKLTKAALRLLEKVEKREREARLRQLKLDQEDDELFFFQMATGIINPYLPDCLDEQEDSSILIAEIQYHGVFKHDDPNGGNVLPTTRFFGKGKGYESSIEQ